MGGCQLTLSNPGDSHVLVAIGLAQGKQDVDLGPIREHLLDDSNLAAVLLLELAHLALVLKCRQRGFCVGPAIAVEGSRSAAGANPSSSREAAAPAAPASTSAARGSRPGLYLRHC